VRHLRAVSIPLSTFDPVYPARPRPPRAGYLKLYLGPDSMLSADTGVVRLRPVHSHVLGGVITAEVSDSWIVATRLNGHFTASFQATHDTIAEATLYRGMFCDRPGAEWYDVQ
jgi:hypothetical protein